MAVVVLAALLEHRNGAVRLVVAHQAIIGDIRPDQVLPGREIGGALGPAGAGVEKVEMDVAEDELLEALVQDLEVFREHVVPPC
jgi:hypothetical protein